MQQVDLDLTGPRTGCYSSGRGQSPASHTPRLRMWFWLILSAQDALPAIAVLWRNFSKEEYPKASRGRCGYEGKSSHGGLRFRAGFGGPSAQPLGKPRHDRASQPSHCIRLCAASILSHLSHPFLYNPHAPNMEMAQNWLCPLKGLHFLQVN